MSSSLKQDIDNDMKLAMRAKETLKLGTIRMLKASIKQVEIDKQITADDTEVLAIINKMIKQRRESEKQFSSAGREELAKKERDEIEILSIYLPEQLSDAAIEAAVNTAIKTTGANSMKDMGKVIGLLKSELQGTADMGLVSQKVKKLLS